MKIAKIVLKVVNVVLTCILVSLLIFAIYGKIQMMVQKKNYVTIFGYTMFEVVSNSMEPAMRINDVILVKTKSSIKVDDIISFSYENAVITHRVISIDGDLITVKGDANNTIDTPIKKNTVIGKVVKVFPELKVWQEILIEPKILICLFVTLLFFDFAFSYKGKKNTKKEKDIEKDIEKVKVNNDDKDIIKDTELMDLTQKIDLSEIDALLAKSNTVSETVVKSKIETTSVSKDDYTVRLDLGEIQSNIAKKVKDGE